MRAALQIVLGAILGIALTSLVVESVEFALVALLHGSPTTDPAEYTAIRNQASFLVGKTLYNFLGGMAGSLVACLIASRRPVTVASVMAVVQIMLFLAAATDPLLRLAMPAWAWFGITISTAVGMLAGGLLRKLVPNKRALVDQSPMGGSIEPKS